jgi:hypothetical protein
MTKFFSILIIAGLLAIAAVASATPLPGVNQNIIQTGKGDNAIQVISGRTDVAIRHADFTNNVFDNGMYVTTVYNMQQQSGVLSLDKGVIEQDRVVKANQVLVLNITRPSSGNATTYYFVSATPMAFWTIDSSVYTKAVKAIESKLDYDPVYDMMNHGTVVPIDVVPYFSDKCSLTPSPEAASIVIDNRYYPEDAVVQIIAVDSGVPQDVVQPQTAMFRNPTTVTVTSNSTATSDMYPSDEWGHAIT